MENTLNALDNISVNIVKNKKTAFVGGSGAGKSTLIELLTSTIHKNSGRIFIDGNEFESFYSIKHLIGYVPQTVYLIDNNIRGNIAFGEVVVDENKVIEALKMAELGDFLEQLENGLETQIGEMGVKLSGGQRQRLGIARALYFNPKILILDEATSSLDNITEKAVLKTIDKLSSKVTIISISHKINSIKNFDQIYILENGKVVESGIHNELLKKSKRYSDLNILE